MRTVSVLVRLDADAARISVAQREVAYQDALQRYEREDALFQRKYTSKEEYEKAKTQLDLAEAQLEQAVQQQLQQAGEGAELSEEVLAQVEEAQVVEGMERGDSCNSAEDCHEECWGTVEGDH